MVQKYTLGSIELIAKEYGLEVLSKEYAPKKKLTFQCKNNHIYESTLQNMTTRKGCSECKRICRFNDFVQFAKENDYEVLTDENSYINTKTKLDMMCPKEHMISIDIDHFKNGKRCRFCKSEKLSADRRLSKDDLFNRFHIKGYEILEGLDSYRNEKDYLTVMCPNGHTYDTMVSVFSHGHGCQQCFDDKRGSWSRGENNHNWKGGITTLKNIFRDSISDWKKKSMFECGYKCIVTGNEFNHIHHLYSFNKIVEEFVNNTHIEVSSILKDYSEEELKITLSNFGEYHDSYGLGVCLQEDVHKLFHKIYGNDNTPEQFKEFKDNYI